jgi:Tfp pilus assembly protein PilF
LTASRIALATVLIVVGSTLFWWVGNKPSYLLYQAHNELGNGNQAGVIAEYRRFLAQKNLSKDDEIKYRKALGEFYVRALQESNGISTLDSGSFEVENPFLSDAKKEFERVLALNPEDGTAHYYLGRILWMQHLEAYAIDELNLSRKYDPKNPTPLWFLASARLERGDATAARDLALQALAIEPNFDEARLALVEAYAALGDHENAVKEYDRISDSFKENPDTKARHALYLGEENDWDTAMRLIEEAVRAAPGNGRVKLIYGRLLLERGLTEEAAGQFAQASALMPKNVWPVVWTVKAAYKRGECDATERWSQLLVEGLPRWGWSHLARAWDRLCKNDGALALAELDEAERLAPELMDAKELKIELLLESGRYRQAGDVIRPLLDQKKDESKAYSYLAESFFLQKNYRMAADMAESAIKSNQRNAMAFVWLGMARASLKDREGAARAFDNAAGLRPFDGRIQNYRQRVNL